MHLVFQPKIMIQPIPELFKNIDLLCEIKQKCKPSQVIHNKMETVNSQRDHYE